MPSWRRSTRKSERGTRNRQVVLLFRVPPSAFRVLPSRDQRAPGDLRLRRVPRQGAKRLAPHRQGVCPGRGRFRGVLRAVLRRRVELGGRRPARRSGLARRDAAARARQALGGAGALGVAHVLPVSRRHARARREPCQGRPHAEARAQPSHAPGSRRDRPVVRGGGAPGGCGGLRGSARPRHARAVLLDGHAARGAGRAERPGSGPRLEPGEGTGQGKKGAHRAGGHSRGAGAAALLPPPRRGRRGGRRNRGPARGVRGPTSQAADAAQRAAGDQAPAGRAVARTRPARPLAAAFVRHAPARRGRRPAGSAGAAGPRLARHHAGVYSYVGGAIEKGIPPGAPESLGHVPPLPKGEGDRGLGHIRFRIHSTTILAVRRDGHVALGGDGQVTLGDTVMKANANKVRALKGGKILAGFAGASADAFTLFEKFEEKLERYPGNLPRAAVELAKDWRSDRVLRRLEALLVVADKEHGYVISGSGELIEPDDGVLAIGSGGNYALAAARALLQQSKLSPKDIVQRSLEIAADICVYTNTHITILEL